VPSFRWGFAERGPIVRRRRALPKFQVSGSDSRFGGRHVDPSRGGPKVFEGLLELLNDFADWLGLCAHTLPLFELSPECDGQMVCLYNSRQAFIT
jgi:hypothetical protein